MRKALIRTAQVLAAAGTLGLARPALAQVSMPDTKPMHGALVRTGAQSVAREVASATTGRTRLEEMRVEVALLANPSTFGCALAARHRGAGLELRGFVPNKFVKEQALAIARKHCTVPVLDKVQVNGAMEVRTPSVGAAELKHGAEALLSEEFGKAAADFNVKAVAPGRLVLHGTCNSCEELVQISKKLRSLNGCCAVDIHLTVKPLLRAGHLVTLVTSDGSLTVAATGASDTLMLGPHVLAGSTAPYRELPAPRSPVLAITQPRPYRMLTGKDSLPPLASAKPKVPAPVVPAHKAEPLPPVVKKPKVPAPVIPAHKAEPLPLVVKKPEVPGSLPPLHTNMLPASAVKSEVPSTKSLPPVAAVRLTPSFTPVAASITTPSAPAVVPATLPPVAAPVGSSASALANVPAYARQLVNSGWQTAPAPVEHLLTPVAVVKTPPPPPGGWPPAYEIRPPVQVAYATTGMVVFDDDTLPEPAPVLAKEKAELLKQKVTAMCGRRASSVRVETTADGKLHVHVKTVAPDKNEALTNSILMNIVPEMASPNVILEVEEPK